jgi:hypothetical protein
MYYFLVFLETRTEFNLVSAGIFKKFEIGWAEHQCYLMNPASSSATYQLPYALNAGPKREGRG